MFYGMLPLNFVGDEAVRFLYLIGDVLIKTVSSFQFDSEGLLPGWITARKVSHVATSCVKSQPETLPKTGLAWVWAKTPCENDKLYCKTQSPLSLGILASAMTFCT